MSKRRRKGTTITLRGPDARAFLGLPLTGDINAPVPPREPERGLRKTHDPASTAITSETFERLMTELGAVYPGKVRRAVILMPAAIEKVIDNEADALATLANIAMRTWTRTDGHRFAPSELVNLPADSPMMPCARCGTWKDGHP